MSKAFITAWLIILIIVAFCIRVHGVGDYGYSEDELLHMGIIQPGSLSEVLRFSLYEAHPPLGHILRHYWGMLSDHIEFARAFSLIFGIALIPLYYRIGRLVRDEMAGLACATFMAFSYGCIIQSYVARNYTFFLFCLSVAIYCYLLWQKKYSMKNLLLYGVFGLMASLTHFFGILVIFCMAASETIRLYRIKADKKTLRSWVAVNLLLGLAALPPLYIWSKTLALAHPYSRLAAPDVGTLLYSTVAFPVHAVNYILPSGGIYLLVAALCIAKGFYSGVLQRFMILAAMALAVDMSMILLLHYSSSGTRHDLWLAPFLLILAGLAVSEMCNLLGRHFSVISKHFPYAAAVMLLGYGILSYDPQRRFADAGEYDIKVRDAEAFSADMSRLDSKSVIIAERDEAFRLKNIYPFLGNDAFTGQVMATKIPYFKSSIITNPYYRRLRTRNLLVKTVEAARDNHMLDGIDTLVFMRSAPMALLAACPELDKTIISFPASTPHHAYNAEEIFSIPAIVLVVSKKTFFKEVVPLSGKAHHCLPENSYLENYVEPAAGNPL